MTDLSSIDIHSLLPQQEPFVMVGKLIEADGARTVTQTAVSPSNLMVESDGMLSPLGIMENIAQTAAASIGYLNKYIRKLQIHIGYIGAIRNLKIYRRPETGETLTTTVITVEEIFGMSLVKATVHVNEELIAETEMKIAVTDRVDHSKNAE